MARKIRRDVPGPDRRVDFAQARAQGWPALFAPLAPPLRLVVEIGFGRGEFLQHLAAQSPQVAHLGIELSWKRALKLARRIAVLEDGGNIRLICAPAQDVVEQTLQPGSVEAFWINFPDPWPKLRHHRRRLLQADFAAQLATRLQPGGALEVATDHAEYAAQIHRVLGAEPRLRNCCAPAPFLREAPGRMHTAYEEMWRSEGRALHFFRYRRKQSCG